ncbi:MAG: hypothetical protein HFG28_11630 [Eubacterium sp.]|nr:hypothetical protein [Eubacterium sp.]
MDLQQKHEFFDGLITGICLYQQKIISAHERKEPLKVGDELFYLQNGRERLAEFLEKVCR